MRGSTIELWAQGSGATRREQIRPHPRSSLERQSMSRALLSAMLMLLGTVSCAAWQANMRRNGYGTNPDVDQAAKANARPPVPMAVLSCWDNPRDPGRDAVDRKEFEATVLPELWRGMGGTGEPHLIRGTGDLDTVCEDLQNKLILNPGWQMGAAAREWLGKEAPADAKSVIFAYYSFTPKCTHQDDTVRDSNGAVIATIDTHKGTCVENGLTSVRIVWASPDGTVLGKIEDACDNSDQQRCGVAYQKAADEVSYMMSFLAPEKK